MYLLADFDRVTKPPTSCKPKETLAGYLEMTREGREETISDQNRFMLFHQFSQVNLNAVMFPPLFCLVGWCKSRVGIPNNTSVWISKSTTSTLCLVFWDFSVGRCHCGCVTGVPLGTHWHRWPLTPSHFAVLQLFVKVDSVTASVSRSITPLLPPSEATPPFHGGTKQALGRLEFRDDNCFELFHPVSVAGRIQP